MKAILIILTVLSLTIGAASTQAGEKMQVTVYTKSKYTTVTVLVGKVEYVFEVADPQVQILRYVRVWNGPDDLLYDLSEEGADYDSTPKQNLPKPGAEMTKAQAAAKWASYLKKYEKIKKDLAVIVLK